MTGVETQTLQLQTRGFNDVIDVTPEIQRLLQKSKISEGNVLVFVPGSTAGLTTIEYEGGLIQDIKDFFQDWIPMEARYHHNERWHDGNGYAHLRAAMLKPSLQIPFLQKKLLLGTWQQIILIDFDNRPRRRELIIQFSGVVQADENSQ